MSLWERLFGREDPVQRLARARTHLADGEFELVIATVMPLEGPEADAIRREAQQRIRQRESAVVEPDVEDVVVEDEAELEHVAALKPANPVR